MRKYSDKEFNALNRELFIGTFDGLVDEVMREMYPDVFKSIGVTSLSSMAYPKVNVLSTDTEVVIYAELAGMTREDISIDVKDRVLTISGKHKATEKTQKGQYLIRELKHSGFSRSFKLGEKLDVNQIDAKLENGVLEIIFKKLVPTPEIKKVVIK